jgi:hypothetical protein
MSAVKNPRRRNRISGQFSPRLIEMLESPAYRVLSRAAQLLISRVEIELAHHGGNDNGRLPVTKEDFVAYGIHPASVAPAIREAEALGFIEVTERGRGGNAEHRSPNMFRLTFPFVDRRRPPTHEWRRIETIEEAEQIAKEARNAKSDYAVARGKRAWIDRDRKPVPKPVPETGITGSGRKPVLLSISRSGAQPRDECFDPGLMAAYEAMWTAQNGVPLKGLGLRRLFQPSAKRPISLPIATNSHSTNVAMVQSNCDATMTLLLSRQAGPSH